jgi:hypothetical protein
MRDLVRWIGIALVVAFFSALTLPTTSISQSNDENLLHFRLRNLHMQGKNIHSILSTISDHNKIPIGLEVSLADDLSISKNITIDVNDSSLEEVLNSIVSQYPIYSWELRDHVINVFPSEAHRDLVLKQVLETKLDSISIYKETRRFNLREMLCKNDAVMKILDVNNVTPANESFTSRDFGNVGRNFSFEASNVSVALVLNRVIRDSQTKYWIIFRDGNRKQYLVLNL